MALGFLGIHPDLDSMFTISLIEEQNQSWDSFQTQLTLPSVAKVVIRILLHESNIVSRHPPYLSTPRFH